MCQSAPVTPDTPDTPLRWLALVHAGLRRPGAPAVDAMTPRILVVDVVAQRMALIANGRVALELPVSTSHLGVGGEEGSHRTPPGWHRIHARIGEGQPLGAEFSSRGEQQVRLRFVPNSCSA